MNGNTLSFEELLEIISERQELQHNSLSVMKVSTMTVNSDYITRMKGDKLKPNEPLKTAPVNLVVSNFTKKMKNKQVWYSDPFLAYAGGYQIHLGVVAAGKGNGKGTHISVFLQLMKGPNDDNLNQSGHFPIHGYLTLELINKITIIPHNLRILMPS